ncbi:MAG: FAD-dependent oxidoreductase [Armatimonadia bacterium]
MERFAKVIIGGGMVGGFCLKEMGKLGVPKGEVCLISADSALPYARPPLSKDYLIDKKPLEKVYVNKEGFYEENGIEVRLQTRVTGLDPVKKELTLEDGDVIGYDNLVLSTGSKVRRLDLPGADLDGVLYLRTLEDCDRLKERAKQAKKLAVIGGGFIGSECASRLGDMGIETTVLYREQRLLDFFLPERLSAIYEGRFRDHGVALRPQAGVAGFMGQGELEGVKLSDGTVIEADMALVAVGVYPDLDLANAAGLRLDGNAVWVDETLQTSAAGVYAGGDVVRYPDMYLGTHRHVEHEEHARVSGRHLAHMLMGETKPYDYLALVWSDVYDLSWEFWGEFKGADEVNYRGDPESADFSAWWLKDGKLLGAMVTYTDRHDAEAAVAQAWIKEGKAVDKAAVVGGAELS